MPKLWNVGPGNIGGGEIGVATIKRRDSLDGKVKDYVRIPTTFSGCVCGPSGASGRIEWDGVCRCGREQLVEHKPGNAYIALNGFGFYVVPRGGWFDAPEVAVKALKDMCPHLVSQEEYETMPALPAPESEVKQEKPKTKPQG